MLKLRYATRLISAFISRFRGLIFLGIGVGILSFFFFNFLSPVLWGRNIERIGVTGRYSPDELPNNISSQISDGLTKLSKDGIVEPDLASSWETPDKGKTWIFHLRSDVYWQDGKKVTSDTISYQFSDVDVNKPDDKTIIFTLQEPFSPFPSVVSKPVFKKGFLGTGTWSVTKANLVGSYIQSLELRNDKKDRKVYKFYPTEERTKLAFKLGEVDEVTGLFNPSPFDSWETVNLKTEVDTGQIVTLFFNTQDQFLKEKTLRQALNYAINKQNLSQNRAISSIPSDSWAYNPQVKRYDYSLDRAKELLGNGDGTELKLVSSPVLLSVAEKIAKDWDAVGIKTVVQVSSVIPTDYQAYLAILDVPKDPDQYAIWHSTQGATNISNFQNPRIDKLLEDGRTQLDLEERRKIYLDFQRFLVEELPAAFLYHPTTYKVVRK